MNINRAIISGATGTIGTALTDLLIENGIDIIILTRPESIRNHRIRKSSLVRVIECDYEKLDLILNNTGVQWDCFFHFAWAGASGEGRNDMFLQNQNVRIALNAVEMAARFGCKKFVGAGSQAEYGRRNEKLTPSTPTFPEMGYGYAKLCAGYMTKDLSHQLGMQFNWLRVLSVFGLHDGANSMIAQTINHLRNGSSPELTKGEQIWDYVYNKDAARAFYLTAEKGIDGKTYVLGSGRERKLSDYLIAIRNIINPTVELKLGARPYSQAQQMYLSADYSELKKDTGYDPMYSFEDGIRDMSHKDPLE